MESKIIIYYLADGTVKRVDDFTLETLTGIHGMKVRLTFEDGTDLVGYCDIEFSEDLERAAEGKCIIMWLAFDPVDGFYNRMCFDPWAVRYIEAILYSGWRWGGLINFKFPIEKESTWHLLASLDDEVDEDEDEESSSLPADSVLFHSMCEALIGGLTEYIKIHPNEILSDFIKSITKDLEAFSGGREIQEYVFTISTRLKRSSTYVSFNIEEGLIEVCCGGSVYDPLVGSDSFSRWMYSIWVDGTEDSEDMSLSSFDIIYSLFTNPDANFDIEYPEEFCTDNEDEDEDEDDDDEDSIENANELENA